ncbi:C-type lectin domain family 7 member A-like [Lytechinus variegatus]|uniref:C-type lectin domain family 7 member A-like n=1 Tax=Lytechinus variegatus TaxID=7654 RepID=UPI001BB1470F|nr:C-type lectin domain family 7 member A-like [Lytechinus variegatus]
MTAQAGQWEGSDCALERSHICQRDSDPRCSWHQSGQSFYRFMGDGRSFDTAQTECASIGGRLAVIRSIKINRFLESFVTPALPSPNCYWFGLSRSSDSEPFIWNDGINLR